CTQALDFPWTF
nr:immunoglobulin light chain junction region [Macaca mulatta]MOY13892.1 immunoglobulin light chain junction region [Macaca mulatta]